MKKSKDIYLIVGAGVSGLAAGKLLRQKGLSARLTQDKKPAQSELDSFKSLDIGFCEPADESLWDGVICLVQSPGISPKHPLIELAREKNIETISEVELGLRYFSGKKIGITGTNGKSTTTAMIAHLLNRSSLSALACGNIGLAVSEAVFLENSVDFLVIELSSYQLETSSPIKLDGACFTSFSPDHLSRHKDILGYFDAKWKITSALKKHAPFVLSQEAFDAAKSFKKDLDRFEGLLILDSPEHLSSNENFFATIHDLQNAKMAASVVQSFVHRVSSEELLSRLKDFKSLPYRYNVIGTLGPWPIINDSKATNVDSCLHALENQNSPCLLLLGGRSKGESFLPVLEYSDKIYEILCFGESGSAIHEQLSSKIPSRSFSSLKDVIKYIRIHKNIVRGPILFSPACASFDEFENFEQRGQFFNQEINDVLEKL